MNLPQLRKRLVRAIELAAEEAVTEGGRKGGHLSRDAAYASGYHQALADVLAVIRGVPPAWERKFWPKEDT